MAAELMPGFSPPPGFLSRFIDTAKGLSSRVLQILAFFVVLYYGVDKGIAYLKLGENVDSLADRVFILSGYTILFFGFVFREWSRSRKERYANTFDRIENFNDTIKEINSYLREKLISDKVEDFDEIEKSFTQQITQSLNDISEIFSMLTGTTCRAAIKCTFSEDGVIYVFSFARDTRSSKLNHEMDQARFVQKKDRLDENEDFHKIFMKKERRYIENDLPSRPGYRNSSFDIYGHRPQSPGLIQRRLFPGWGWHLPYRSTMVFAIQQKPSHSLSIKNTECIGFLAVDSGFRNVFEDRFDGPLGSSLADSLFGPFASFVMLKSRMKKGGQ
jgi:hypothetical protein